MAEETPVSRPAAPKQRHAEIIEVALRLFNEQGYDKTSLREIADEIGVTKAALYYHFPSKEDIVRAALEEYTQALTELVDRAEQVSNIELVDELLELFTTIGGEALRFAQTNPTAMSQLRIGEVHTTQLQRLGHILAGGAESAEASLRAVLAVGAVVFSITGSDFPPLQGSADERRRAARTVALELLAGLDSQA